MFPGSDLLKPFCAVLKEISSVIGDSSVSDTTVIREACSSLNFVIIELIRPGGKNDAHLFDNFYSLHFHTGLNDEKNVTVSGDNSLNRLIPLTYRNVRDKKTVMQRKLGIICEYIYIP